MGEGATFHAKKRVKRKMLGKGPAPQARGGCDPRVDASVALWQRPLAGARRHGILRPRRASSPSRSSGLVPNAVAPGTVQKISNSSPSGSLAYKDRLTP